jgi:predicted PurR-regulated permease PerM
MSRRAVSLWMLAFLVALLVAVAADVLFIIFAGVLFAVFLHGGGSRISRYTGLPVNGGIAAFCALILLIATLGVVALSPAITEQAEELSRRIPLALTHLRGELEEYSWGKRLMDKAWPGLFSSETTSVGASAVMYTFGIVGNTVIIAFVGLYGALAPATYANGAVRLLAPSLRPRAAQVLARVGDTLGDWLIAKFISMTIVGVLTWLGLWLVGTPLPLVLALIAALFGFVPNIGPIVAAVPAILLTLANGATGVLMVAGVYLVVQTLESYLITPLVQQQKVSLPPVLIISAQLLMGVLFGLPGLALATPLAAALLTFVREVYVGDYLEREEFGPSLEKEVRH